ncbi:hypothetical protein [Nitrosophilus labii]|uniref:hypothetical protein n=1 Tax=Nitrosophilus labii TaxID=2706014 RepID=UPI001656D6AC|nr:hypothetical protein [Nitrosophilus labii]
MFTGLSLDQAPPFEAPLRFFLTAPIFAIAAAVLIFFSQDLSSIHSPETVAILHLFTIGFMSMIMIGAMQQMLPVLVGVTFPKPIFFSKIIHISLILGTVLFAAGLYFFKTPLIMGALFFLLVGMGIFALITLYKLFSASYSGATVNAMKLSLISLFITLLLGAHLLVSLGISKVSESFDTFLSLHAMFAVFGWVGLLIIGVSYQVIPMFYVTPDFEEKIKKYLDVCIFTLLILSTAALFIEFKYILTVLSALYIIFAVATLKLYGKRKRKLKDITINYWMLSSVSLIFGAILLTIYLFTSIDQLLWIGGVLLIYGFAISLINGMLYKIIPFLAWFHLSSRGFFDIPTMKEMIKDKDAKLQLIFHTLALISLLILPFLPLEKLSALLIAISNILLLRNLLKAAKIYFEYRDKPSPVENFGFKKK